MIHLPQSRCISSASVCGGKLQENAGRCFVRIVPVLCLQGNITLMYHECTGASNQREPDCFFNNLFMPATKQYLLASSRHHEWLRPVSVHRQCLSFSAHLASSIQVLASITTKFAQATPWKNMWSIKRSDSHPVYMEVTLYDRIPPKFRASNLTYWLMHYIIIHELSIRDVP